MRSDWSAEQQYRARLSRLESQVNINIGRLGSRVEELASQVNGTSAGQSGRLDRISSRLDDLAKAMPVD